MSPILQVPTRPAQESGDLGLLEVAELLLRRRRPLLTVPAVLAVAVATFALLQPRTYTSTASFMPQATRAPSSLLGIAAQFGMSVPFLSQGGESPSFYVQLIQTREILSAVAMSEYTVTVHGQPRQETLVDFYHPNGDTPALRLARATDSLARKLDVDFSTKTSIVTFSIRATEPQLAAAIARRILDEVNDFNLKKRASQAGAERRFTEQRLTVVESQLRQAENALQTFLQQNRDYRNSPPLLFQEQRLERVVSLRQQLFTTLSQAVEQARIEEVRNTPVITVVEDPQVPPRPDHRRLLLKITVALLSGVVIGVLVAAISEYWSRRRDADPEKLGELRRLVERTRSDLVRPWRLFRRPDL